MEMKKCSKCGEVKGVEEFCRDECRKDGLRPWCKTCISEYYLNNKERIKEQRKEYYCKNKEQFKERSKEYRLENKEPIKQRNKKYHIKNKERRKEQHREYYRENKERLKEYYKEHRIKNKEQRKEYYLNNLYILNRIHYNVNTCSEELKPIIEALILIKNKKSYIRKEIQK